MHKTENIHAVRHPFRLLLEEGRYAERFVHSYIIAGKTICLIDAGVAATAPLIAREIESLGRSPKEVSLILLTHCHPDHIGGLASLRRSCQAPVAVHPSERAWVEDVNEQFRSRPIPNLFELAPEGVAVARDLADGERIPLEEGRAIRVIATPGHSTGSVSFLDEEEGALFTGDAVPVAGSIPIYTDPQALLASLAKIESLLSDVRVLFSAWHEGPLKGAEIAQALEEGRRYVETIDAVVRELEEQNPEITGQELSKKALERLGIRVPKVLFMVEAAFTSHLA